MSNTENVEFGRSAYRFQRGAGPVQKDCRTDVGGLLAELPINFGWPGEKINRKLRA